MNAVRSLCQTHPEVNYKTAWGCPECVRELRQQRAALVAALKDACEVLECLRRAENEDHEQAGKNIPWPVLLPKRYTDALELAEKGADHE